MSKKITYRQAGVDIDAADAAITKVKQLINKAHGPEVLKGIGAFGGLFQPSLKGMIDPVLVSSADGIGTKVMIANAVNKFRNLGHDLVNHCVNDIAVMGATPLFFLDYLAFGHFRDDVAVELISGFVEACTFNGCSLLGGETAEMPDLYADDDFDVAGFIVGMVDKNRIIDGHTITPGDTLIGITSNGLHTNGYSLVRKVFFAKDYSRVDEAIGSGTETLSDILLRPHLSYLPLIKALDHIPLKGLAHITGGGIGGNLIRILPEDMAARVRWGSWSVPSLFTLIQDEGSIVLDEMLRVFNMGIGLIIVCDEQNQADILSITRKLNYSGSLIGSIHSGKREVTYE